MAINDTVGLRRWCSKYTLQVSRISTLLIGILGFNVQEEQRALFYCFLVKAYLIFRISYFQDLLPVELFSWPQR